MFNLKKSSIFFTKISKFYLNILNFEIFSIYNFFGSFFFFYNKFSFLINYKNLNYILVNTNFLNIIFKNGNFFFNLFNPQSLVFFFSNFNCFLEINENLLKTNYFFLVGFCFKFFFVSVDKIFNLFLII